MPADGAVIVKRYLNLRNERHNFDDRWEEMAPFIAPTRRGIITKWSPGDKMTRGVYDSTALLAAEQMAMFIAGHVINPSQRWFNFQPRNPALNRIDSVREWMEESRDRTLKFLSSSMFYAEGPESMIDYGGFGTGFLLCEEAPQPVNRTHRGFRGFYFKAEKIGRYVIAEGADGLVDTFMREFDLTARIAKKEFGDELSRDVALAAEKEPDKPITFIHAVYPREKGDQSNSYGTSKGMPWASCWVEKESTKIVKESGYRVFPAAVPRYMKTPGEVYGRGRGDIAFPDTWTLNSAKRMGLEDWALKIKPPIMVRNDSVVGTLRLVPGGPTSINTRGEPIQNAIMPWQTGSHPEVSHIKEEELRRTIREVFYVDAIRQLMEVNKSEMTAFEFAKKLELLFRLMGPVYGRMEWEYLWRIVDIMFDLCFHAGVYGPPPTELMEEGGDVDLDFQNPIAKAQRSGDSEALVMAIGDLAPMTQVYPQMWDRIDPDRMAEGILLSRGVPAAWTRSDKEMEALRAARQKQQEQEAALATAGQIAESAGKAAPFIEATKPEPTR